MTFHQTSSETRVCQDELSRSSVFKAPIRELNLGGVIRFWFACGPSSKSHDPSNSLIKQNLSIMGCCLSCILPPRERRNNSHASPTHSRPQNQPIVPGSTVSSARPKRAVRITLTSKYPSEEQNGPVSESSPLLPRTSRSPNIAASTTADKTSFNVDRYVCQSRFTLSIVREANLAIKRCSTYAKVREDEGHLRTHWATVLAGLQLTRPTNEAGTLTPKILVRACRCDDHGYFLVELLRGLEQDPQHPHNRTEALLYQYLQSFRYVHLVYIG